jgi:methylated-DNA-protein-cysteine methyltransferase-like protein
LAYQKIYAVVCGIPKGRVATYGQVARLAGLGGAARQVGYALYRLEEDTDVPWQRVINARGEVSARAEPGMEGVQRSLLKAEGIAFKGNGQVDLGRFRWRTD